MNRASSLETASIRS